MSYYGPPDLNPTLSDPAIENPAPFSEDKVLGIYVLSSLLLASDLFP